MVILMDMDLWSLKGFKPRDEQVRIIDKIITAMDCGYHNIVLEAGTGVGKSAIATTIANKVSDTYILTRTKQLQEQYLKDFSYMLTEIKGRNNYICYKESTSDFTFTCDSCDKNKPCTSCNYMMHRTRAMYADTTLANYDYLYYSSLYSDNWDQRELLVLDEAHKFESFIMGKVTRSFSDNYCKQVYGIDIFSSIRDGDSLTNWIDPVAWIPIIEKIIVKLHELERKYKQQLVIGVSKREKAMLLKRIKKIPSRVQNYYKLIDELKENSNEWVVLLPTKSQISNPKITNCTVEFKPVTVQKFTKDILNLGETRLFMTATIGDEDKFCEWININKEDTFFIYEKGSFPVENRPIYKTYVRNMKGTHKDSNGWSVPNWKCQEGLDKILEICMEYPDQKGIIHTTSHAQTYWILENLSEYLPLWKIEADKKQNWNQLTREEVVDRFIATDIPAILVGAGIKDGVDFKDDACRFQILYKTPFPAFDAQVRKRNLKDKVWWNYQAVMDSMQSYGRGVRSETDYCDFYILDKEFDNLLRRWKHLFNEYFLEAIQ